MDKTKDLAEKYEVLQNVILGAMDYILESLLELNAIEQEQDLTPALYGRKCAFVEAMEKLMEWPDAKEFGYTWNVETEFPV